MPEEENELDQAFPKFKSIVCPFCHTSLGLVRRTFKQSQFYYVESTWADDFRNHDCKRKVPLGRVGVDKVEKMGSE